MNRQRLELVAEILHNLKLNEANEDFYMGLWRKQEACKTSACAIGWAASDDRLVSQGLTLHAPTDCAFLIPKYKNLEDFAAIEKFFDISEGVADWLFGGDRYSCAVSSVTANMVANRIDDYLAGRAWPNEYEDDD